VSEWSRSARRERGRGQQRRGPGDALWAVGGGPGPQSLYQQQLLGQPEQRGECACSRDADTERTDTAQVEDLKSILIEQSDDEDEPDSESTFSAQHQGFIFGYSSTSVDMLSLHPPQQHAHLFWDTYKENVDPLVKVLHIPTFEPVLLEAISNPDKITKSLEPLMFAIYYGAVTSMTRSECVEQYGEDRDTLLHRYRFGLEQGLARANFLFCDEMIILQAFVVFLILLRRNDDARKIWTLTGLAVRIAQTLGIHRDGSHFSLTPFDIEMRRRLWWQVCILDARSSEDHGCDPTIVEAQFDTKLVSGQLHIDGTLLTCVAFERARHRYRPCHV
jgi:hypothetical protein